MFDNYSEKKDTLLRAGIMGHPGSGKSHLSVAIARKLKAVMGGEVLLIDTEHRRSQYFSGMLDFRPKYTDDVFANDPGFQKIRKAFNSRWERYRSKGVVEMGEHNPLLYSYLIRGAREFHEKSPVSCLIVDNMSNEWYGNGGCLHLNENVASAKYKGNSYVAWGDTKPLHEEVVANLLSCPFHVILVMRAKDDIEMQDVNGKSAPVKVGTKAIQQGDLGYELDFLLEMERPRGVYQRKMSVIKSMDQERFPIGSEMDVKNGSEDRIAENVVRALSATGDLSSKNHAKTREAPAQREEHGAHPGLSLEDFTDEERALVKAKHPDIRNVASLRLRFPGWTKEQVMEAVAGGS